MYHQVLSGMVSIKLKVGEQALELTLEEAQQLKDELTRLFGSQVYTVSNNHMKDFLNYDKVT